MLFHAEATFDAFGGFSRGYLFVDFFFLLSGFVLTLAAEKRMNQGTLTSWRFLRSRIIRLWPTIAVGVLIGGASAGIIGDPAGLPRLIAMGVLMVPVLSGGGQIFPLNGPQWSLLMELIANFAHALLLRRLGKRWLLAFVVIAALALCATTISYGSNTLGPFSFNWWLALPRVAFSYALGIYLARRWQAQQYRPLISWRIALMLPLGAIVVLSIVPIDIAAGDLAITLAIFPCLFWLAATANVPLAAQPWLTRLGGLSFPLYAVHLPMLEVFAHFGNSAATMIAAIGAALLAAHLIDLALTPAKAQRSAIRRPIRESLPT